MRPDDPEALELMRRSMVARIATVSRTGRPGITPLYFVLVGGHLWLGTPEWTLAVRNVRADPRVSVLFEVEGDRGDRRVLRVSGRGGVRADRTARRAYALRAARRYVLTPGGIRHLLAHARQLPLRRAYAAQSAARGPSAVIDVVPERAELLLDGDQAALGR